jgi:hypothetical protein
MNAREILDSAWPAEGDRLARVTDAVRTRVTEALPLLGTVFGLWLLTRLGYVLVTYLAGVLQLSPVPPPLQPPGFTDAILRWQRWDVNHYLIVSRVGYSEPGEANFFPLYPLSVGAVSWLLGDGSAPGFPTPDKLRLVVGMALSNLGLLVGLYAIARLAQVEGGRDGRGAASRAVRFALAYPFAIAFAVAYAEGFFLAFAALALLCARRGHWAGAALAAALGGLTRPIALILVLPLLWEYGRQHGWWARLGRPSWGQLARGAVIAGAAPAAMCVYFTYLWVRFGDFLLPLHTQQRYFGHVTMPQWRTFGIAIKRLVTTQGTGLLLFDVALVALFTAIVLLRIRRAPFAYTLYMAGLLFMTSISPTPSQADLLWGTGRYLGLAIPIYLALAEWSGRRPWLDTIWFTTGMTVQGAMTIALFQGKPVL